MAGRRALVTGGAGFVGRWLVAALVEAGYAVTATAQHHPASAAPPMHGAPPALPGAVQWVLGDVREAAHLDAAIAASRPDVVFHLAGVTFVPAAGDDPGHAADVNVVAAARLLARVRVARDAGIADPVILMTGSGEQYGRHDGAHPLREDAPQRPHSVYAATKVAQEAFALQAGRTDGLRVIATRPFNHSGPGQNPRFLLPALASRVLALRAAAGRPDAPPALVLGNTAPVRDFLHVADVVAAYIALAERGRAGEAYNVASGVGRSVADVAAAVLARAGVDVPIASDPALVRAADVPALVGDAAKLRADTGWAPSRTFDALLDDLLAAGSPAAPA